MLTVGHGKYLVISFLIYVAQYSAGGVAPPQAGADKRDVQRSRRGYDLLDLEFAKAFQNELRIGLETRQHLVMNTTQFLYRFGLRFYMIFNTKCTNNECTFVLCCLNFS